MIEPNLIALLTDDDMERQVPETLKDAAWQRHYDEEGNLTFSQRSWGAMTRDEHYIAWYGPTEVIVDLEFEGKLHPGNTHVVKGRFYLVNDIDALDEENLKIVEVSKWDKFLEENESD